MSVIHIEDILSFDRFPSEGFVVVAAGLTVVVDVTVGLIADGPSVLLDAVDEDAVALGDDEMVTLPGGTPSDDPSRRLSAKPILEFA